jgi:transcriptional regulator with AAA-type ATPase domain/transcriptional regulatory protein LevR
MSIEKSLLELIELEGKTALSDQEIADQLKVTREYVSTIRKKLNIESSKKRLEPQLTKELKILMKDHPSYSLRKLTSILNDKGYSVSTSFVNTVIKKHQLTSDNNLKIKKNISETQELSLQTHIDKKAATEYDPFLKMIGSQGSLKSQILHAKAAVLYPPKGLNTIIIGESGVGKSLLAKLMYEFAVANDVIKKDKFIVFNCADYSENVQLLYSHLFGHVKGAFTGAEKDKDGLISLANEGMIFLDEVHRLPAEGQEMLFNVIDNGKYRKLGQTEIEHDVSVMVIAATTENIESKLLGTFRRRIPMIIELPPLSIRPINEKLEFIEYIVNKESSRIGQTLSISHEAYSALKKYTPTYNFGSLESELKVTIAKAYLLYSIGERNQSEVTLDMLPTHVRDLWFNSPNDDVYSDIVSSNLKITKDTLVNSNDHDSTDIYKYIDQKKSELLESGYSKLEINSLLQSFIVENIKYHMKESDLIFSEPIEAESLIGKELLQIIDDFIIYAQQIIPELVFKRNLKIALGHHVSIAIERIKNNLQIIHPSLDRVQSENKELFDLSLHLISALESKYQIEIPKDEAAYICMYLNQSLNRASTDLDIGILVVCHGKVASAMLDVAKYFIKDTNVYAIDMDMDINPLKIFKVIKSKIKEMNCKKGILLLTDMGSLTEMWKNLRNDLNLEISSVPRVDTVMLMDAMYWRKVCESSQELINKITNTEIKKEITLSNENKPYIIIYCITGEGSSRHIIYHLKKFIPEIENDYNIEFMGLMYDDTISKIIGMASTNSIKLLIGNMPLEENRLNHIPHINIHELMSVEGVNKLRYFLGRTEISELSSVFSNNHIYANMKFSSRKEVLDFICAKFESEGIVNKNFRNSVYERENWTNTYIGSSISLPHPVNLDTINISQVAIITLMNEIDWDGFPVKIICLFAIKSSGDKYFKSIYKKLTFNLSAIIDSESNFALRNLLLK